MKLALKEVQDEINQIREVQKELEKEHEMDELASDGKKCHDAKKFKPNECYLFIFGSLESVKRAGHDEEKL
jgi:hypothetical protein